MFHILLKGVHRILDHDEKGKFRSRRFHDWPDSISQSKQSRTSLRIFLRIVQWRERTHIHQKNRSQRLYFSWSKKINQDSICAYKNQTYSFIKVWNWSLKHKGWLQIFKKFMGFPAKKNRVFRLVRSIRWAE